MVTKLYIIRHAEAEGNIFRRAHGWYNGLITQNGRRHIERLEQRMRSERIDRLYASDLIRTMDTAGAVSRACSIEIIKTPGLREIDMGDWDDWPWGKFAREYPDMYKTVFNYADWSCPNGDSIRSLYERTNNTVDHLLELNEGKSICIVSHSVAIRTIMCHLYGLPVEKIYDVPAVNNASVSLFEFEGSEFREVYVNDFRHIEDLPVVTARRPTGFEGDLLLWFRGVESEDDISLVENFWSDAWKTVHGNLSRYDRLSASYEIKRIYSADRDSVILGMLGDKIAGVVLCDSSAEHSDNSGHITLFALSPEFRGYHLAVQLLGQAVSYYRALGRDTLRLRVSEKNTRALKFYSVNDFHITSTDFRPGDTQYIMKRKI